MDRLQIYMDVLEYSRLELAEDIGCNRSLIRYWLIGKCKPRGVYLERLCECLGIEPEMVEEEDR